jgi:DNA-binding winged helix-turn-helix (wHTH) protein
MTAVAYNENFPNTEGVGPSASVPNGHPLRSMVIASKRFGPREWFVIHPADAPSEATVRENIQELLAPLVVPIFVVASNVEERDRIVSELAQYVETARRPRGEDEHVSQIEELRVDKHAHRVSVGDAEVVLTSLELRLLVTLIERRDRVQSRSVLLHDVWGISAQNRTRTVDTHVKRLRDKLRTAGRFVQSVRGVGYRFSATPLPQDRRGCPAVSPNLRDSEGGTGRSGARQEARSLAAASV